MGDVRFLHLTDEEALGEPFRHLGGTPQLFCSVEASGGTNELLVERARRAANSALALIRQQVLFGFGAKIYLDQVAFGLDGRYALKADGKFAGWGWWAQRQALDTDLSEQEEWAKALSALAERRQALAPDIRQRADTSLDWLDVAARTDNWRVMLPSIFSAMEALLVPEDSGLKAGAVTVRSVAVHVAVGSGFFDPNEVVEGYLWRSKLVHGAPTHDVNDTELTALAEDRQRWAFRVFGDYLRLAGTADFKSVGDLVSFLDSGPAKDVCHWLVEHGAKDIIDEYNQMLAPPKTNGVGKPR